MAKKYTADTITATSFTGSLQGSSISSSYALSASYAPPTFPFTGSAIISSSLGVTGPTSITGSLANGLGFIFDVIINIEDVIYIESNDFSDSIISISESSFVLNGDYSYISTPYTM